MNFKPHDFCISCARKLLREQSIAVCAFARILAFLPFNSIQFHSIQILFFVHWWKFPVNLKHVLFRFKLCAKTSAKRSEQKMRDNNNFGRLVRCHVDVDNRGNIYWLAPLKWINWIFVKLWKKFAQVFHVLCTDTNLWLFRFILNSIGWKAAASRQQASVSFFSPVRNGEGTTGFEHP